MHLRSGDSLNSVDPGIFLSLWKRERSGVHGWSRRVLRVVWDGIPIAPRAIRRHNPRTTERLD
jgi:hypothetical protein